MKRITALFVTAVLICLSAVTAFADNIYIVDDENDFVPPTTTEPTTEKPRETTTSSIGSIFGNGDSLDSYFDGIADKLGNGIDSILSGFGQFANNGNSSQSTTQLQPYNNNQSFGTVNQRPNSSGSSNGTAVSTTQQSKTEENTTAPTDQNNYRNEVASVLVVNQMGDSDSGISGSTLTLVVFIAAVVLLVLVVAVVLVVMTRKTAFNSAVMNKSTIPSVSRPDNLAGLMDDIDDDNNDYSDISYWDSSDFR